MTWMLELKTLLTGVVKGSMVTPHAHKVMENGKIGFNSEKGVSRSE